MNIDFETCREWLAFLYEPKNSTEVQKYDDYTIANNIMRQWMTESYKVGE